MQERITEKNGERVTEVRSEGGKLLFIKTKSGYEMKCPRTKKICLVKYEEMIRDCFSCLDDEMKGEIRQFLNSAVLTK